MMKPILPILTTTALFLSPTILHAQTYQPSNRIPIADTSQIGTQVSGTNNNFDITGGLQRGQNLFHSFTDFSVPTNGAANFTNPVGNQSIITRVTGNLFSDVNGLIKTNGANFLLINPTGVVFGSGAKLDVGKAFVTTTASGIDFIDAAGRNYNFGVNQAGDTPLLSIDQNIAFNPAKLIMNANIPGSRGIENYGTLQTNNSGQYIGLIGGDINFYGGQLIAPGAKVELGGLIQAGSIDLNLDNGIKFPANVDRGNVSLQSNGTASSLINVRSGGGGSVGIFAKDITLKGTGTDSSLIRVGIAAGLGSPTATAGDINLDARGNIQLSEGAGLSASTFGKGTAGNIKINTPGNVSFDNGNAFSEVATGGEGKGGEIEIVANNLSVTNTARLNAGTYGKGDAGSIKIKATGNVSFDGRKDGVASGAFNSVATGGEGKGGGIEIVARNLAVTNGAKLSASTFGKGDAGNIKINATDNVSFDGRKDEFTSTAFSSVGTGGEGTGGGIEIVARNLAVTNGANLSASTFGKGDAGNIKIKATGNVSFDRGNAFNTVGEGGEGTGGRIEIVAGNLVVNNATLNASTYGKGDAGDINIKTSGNLTIYGTKYPDNSENYSFVSSNSDGLGNTGKITLDAQGKLLIDLGVISNSIYSRLVDKNGTIIYNEKSANKNDFKIINIVIPNRPQSDFTINSADNWQKVVANNSVGNSQTITLRARELEVKNNSRILADAGGKGNAGDIKITTIGSATISSSAIDTNIGRYAEGNTGNISFDTGGKLIFNDSKILSIVAGGIGNGQGINIQANELNLNQSKIYSSTSGRGNAGNIRIVTTGDIVLSNSTILNGSSSSWSFSSKGTPFLFFPIPDLEGAKLAAGNTDIYSKGLFLDNSFIVSSSDLGKGGDIKLRMSDKLLLRGKRENYSTISTESGLTSKGIFSVSQNGNLSGTINTNTTPFGGAGSGGNITINSPLIIALPGNNDITANAYQGNGGKVKIDSQGLFGIQYRPKGSPFTNDITASSTFGQSGNVQVNTPGTDPGKNKGELAAVPNDASKQISQACGASQRENKFYITGRGGLPPTARDPLESEAVWQDARAVTTKPAPTANQIQYFPQPAIGWQLGKNGRVNLIAAQTGAGSAGTRVVCPNR